jgi:Tol biopolymer transport system component
MVPSYLEEIYRSEIYTFDFSKRTPVQLTKNILIDGGPSYSPDGRKIAFLRARGNPHYLLFYVFRLGNWKFDVFMMNADGTGEERVTFNNYSDMGDASVAFSPDGANLLFSVRHGLVEQNLFVVNLVGARKPVRLTRMKTLRAHMNISGNASFSPDGRQILYTIVESHHQSKQPPYWVRFEYQIWTMNTDGSGKKRLFSSTREIQTPVFSSDAGKIYFLGTSGGSFSHGNEIWEMDPDGRNPRMVLSLPLKCHPWQ